MKRATTISNTRIIYSSVLKLSLIDYEYLHNISTCVLQDMSVSYGGDRYKTFDANNDGAPPVETSMSLNFQEMELITRERVHEGF